MREAIISHLSCRLLRHTDAEIAMLRSRVPKKRIFLTNEERERLLELGEAIGSEAASLIAIVSGRDNVLIVAQIPWRPLAW